MDNKVSAEVSYTIKEGINNVYLYTCHLLWTIISLQELGVFFWDGTVKGSSGFDSKPTCANNTPFFEQRYKSLTMRKHQFTWFSSELLIFALGFSGVGLFNWRTATK